MHICYGGANGKNLPANSGDTRDASLTPGLGRSPGEGNSNSLQYSCLENPRDIEAWGAIVYGVARSQTRLSMHDKLLFNFLLLVGSHINLVLR